MGDPPSLYPTLRLWGQGGGAREECWRFLCMEEGSKIPEPGTFVFLEGSQGTEAAGVPFCP